jgi:hypothetical protein
MQVRVKVDWAMEVLEVTMMVVAKVRARVDVETR